MLSPIRRARQISMDANWKFAFPGQLPSGAEDSGFDDSNWRAVNVPYDWSIEEACLLKPINRRRRRVSAGRHRGGIARSFRYRHIMPVARISIELDGVMQNSDVWTNGHLLGHRPNGYVGLSYELTDIRAKLWHQFIECPRRAWVWTPRNNLASRWYLGGGIYRHVRLIVTDPVQHC